MKFLTKLTFLIFFIIILFNNIIKAQPLVPNLQNWNIKAAKCIDGDGDVEIQNSLLNGVDYTKKITLAPSKTKTILIQLPALQNDGMFVFSIENNMLDVAIGYYFSDDGIIWGSAQALYSTQTDNQLQKIDIPKSQGNKWMKFTFKNNNASNPILKEFGLYEFRLSGRHNYFLVLGASITASAGGLTDWRQSIQNKFPTDSYKPVVFNWAVSGSKTIDLYNKIDEFLGQHPYAAYVLVETGGNDVTTTRPLIYGSNDAYITTMDTRIRNIIQKIKNAGKIPVFWRISFRDYKNVFPVNQGKNQENGSLPYNFTIDKIIKDLTPDFYNNQERRGMVDFYSFTLNNQSWLKSVDGIHFNPEDTYHIRDCWIDNAIKYIYKGTRTNPIPYNEYVTNLRTLSTNSVVVAETSKSDKDIYNARILVEQIADTPTRISLLDRLDNINNPQPKTFYLKSTGDISDINNWGSNADGTGTIPLNFTSNSLTLIINRDANLSTNFIANGLNSKLVIKKNKNLTLMPSANLNSVLDLEDGSTLDNQSTNQVTFGKISPTSTVIFSSNAVIPSISFGKIILAGNASKKKLSSGTLHILGDLLIKDQIDFSTSATDNTIDLKGNLTCQQNINTSDKKFLNFVFSSSGNQLLSSIGVNALFNSLSLTTGTNLNLDANTQPEIGNLILNDGSKFIISNNTISITTSLNPINQKGQIESNGGSVNFNTGSDSHIYTSSISNVFKGLTIDAHINKVFLHSNLSLITSLKLKTGNFDVTGGNLILLSNNTSTASIQKVETGASMTGKITMQRFIPTPTYNRGWFFISSPVKNQTVNDWNNALLEGPWNGKISNVHYFSENCLPNPLWKWNNIYSFQNYGWFETASLTENIQCGKGYKFFLYNSFFQGNHTLSNIGDPIIGDGKDNIATAGEQFIFPVTYQLDGKIGYGGGGWNLISNPYPSNISWTRQGWTKTNIDNAIYIWNPSKKSYGTFIKNIGTNGASGKIATGQAFFIKANNNNPVLTASEDVKTDTIASFLRIESDPSELLKITIKNDQDNSDEIVLYKEPTSPDAFDGNLDALKFFGEALNISSIKSDSISLSIHSLNENVEVVKLSVLKNPVGKYTFLINGVDKFSKSDSIFLLDNFLQKKIHIKEDLNYNFELTGDSMSVKNSRFAIVLHSRETTPPNLHTDFKLLIHSNPALQNIILTLQTDNNQDVRLFISDMAGKLIYDNMIPVKFLIDKFKIPVSLSKGMYVISCKQGDKVIYKKVVLE